MLRLKMHNNFKCLNFLFKFGQKEVTAKDFYRQRQITDIFTIDVNKVVFSDKVMQKWKGLSFYCGLSSLWSTDTTVYQDV